MSSILVVYFSRSGRTRQIAEAIAGQLGADIEPIQDVRDRSGIRGYFRSLREAVQHRVVEVGTPARSPAGYDLVILGTPVWAHNMCSPMRSYLTAHSGRFKAIAVFCTQGGSGGRQVADQVAALCGRSPIAAVILDESEIKQDRFAGKLHGFIESISTALAT